MAAIVSTAADSTVDALYTLYADHYSAEEVHAVQRALQIDQCSRARAVQCNLVDLFKRSMYLHIKSNAANYGLLDAAAACKLVVALVDTLAQALYSCNRIWKLEIHGTLVLHDVLMHFFPGIEYRLGLYVHYGTTQFSADNAVCAHQHQLLATTPASPVNLLAMEPTLAFERVWDLEACLTESPAAVFDLLHSGPGLLERGAQHLKRCLDGKSLERNC